MVERYRDLIAAYFKEHSFSDLSLKSFDDFIENRMQKILEEVRDIVPTIIPQEVESYVIRLKKIWIEKPSVIEADGSKRDIFPNEARLRKLTYSAPMFVEVSAYVDDVQRETFECMVGKLPILLKSKYCHLSGLKREELIQRGEDPDDPGGYFIINGNERVVITVEDLAPNKLFIDKKTTGPSEYVGKLFSEAGSFRIPHTLEKMKEGIFLLSFTRFKRIPVVAIIKSLGITKESEIKDLITFPEYESDAVFINLYDAVNLKTQDDALEFLGKKMGITQPREVKIERAREMIDKYLLPHLGVESKDRKIKAHNLGRMVAKFMAITEEGYELPDKDHYMNKRLRLVGDLFEDLLRTNLRVLVQDVMYNFQRLVKRGKFLSIKIIIRDELLTSNLKSALATGAWTAGRKGISQNMDRTNMLATASHLQRVLSLLTSTQENFEARALHPTHFGKLCPIETPEGTPIGLRKNLALMCDITASEIPEDKIKKALTAGGLKLVE